MFHYSLSRFAGVSEAIAERESAGEILSGGEGSVWSRFAGVSLSGVHPDIVTSKAVANGPMTRCTDIPMRR
jgi:hypothetical protein